VAIQGSRYVPIHLFFSSNHAHVLNKYSNSALKYFGHQFDQTLFKTNISLVPRYSFGYQPINSISFR